MKGGSVAELLIGLAYNGTTGRLSVEIIKGSHFRGGGGADTKPPDTYVKLALVDSNGHEMGRSKTGLRRAQPNPLYKETFIYQVRKRRSKINFLSNKNHRFARLDLRKFLCPNFHSTISPFSIENFLTQFLLNVSVSIMET